MIADMSVLTMMVNKVSNICHSVVEDLHVQSIAHIANFGYKRLLTVVDPSKNQKIIYLL